MTYEIDFTSCGVNWVATYEPDDECALVGGIYLVSDQQMTNLLDVSMAKVEEDAQEAADADMLDRRVCAAEDRIDWERENGN